MSKNSKRNFCIYIQKFYVCTQSFKKYIFCGFCKKIKKRLMISAYWTSKFPFYTSHKNDSIFIKTLCVNIEYLNIHAKKLFQFYLKF
jgi:hypothetical protein